MGRWTSSASAGGPGYTPLGHRSGEVAESNHQFDTDADTLSTSAKSPALR